MDKSLLVVIDDFSDRVLDYSNTVLVDYGYLDKITYIDNFYDVYSGAFSGYGNYDDQEVQYASYSDFYFVPNSPDLTDPTLQYISSASFTDSLGYTAYTDDYYWLNRSDQSSETFPNHGDWVVERIHQVLENPEQTTLLLIDVDAVSGSPVIYQWESLFGQRNYSFEGNSYYGSTFEAILLEFLEYNDTRYSISSDITYLIAGLSLSIAGSLPNHNESLLLNVLEQASIPVFQSAPNVNQGDFDWGVWYPDVINVGAWNTDSEGDVLLSSIETLSTIDIVANGYVYRPEWGGNFGTSFATPSVAAQHVNWMNSYLEQLNREGLSIADLGFDGAPTIDYSDLTELIEESVSTSVVFRMEDGHLYNMNLSNFDIAATGLTPLSLSGYVGGIPNTLILEVDYLYRESSGSGANNVFYPTISLDDYYAGQGIDTAVYPGVASDYVYINAEGVVIIAEQLNEVYSDYLYDLERLSFDDTNIALDLSGNAGLVAKILGAVFGQGKDGTEFNPVHVGIGLAYLDAGMDYVSLTELAIYEKLGGQTTNGDVVDLLYNNVAGVLPGIEERNEFISLLDDGSFTVGELGIYAADHELNATNIDLVGLSTTGIEFI